MEPAKQPNSFFKYSSLAIQMGVIIGLTAWAGQKLDHYYHMSTPVFTIILSLTGIGSSLYLVIKELIKPNS